MGSTIQGLTRIPYLVGIYSILTPDLYRKPAITDRLLVIFYYKPTGQSGVGYTGSHPRDSCSLVSTLLYSTLLYSTLLYSIARCDYRVHNAYPNASVTCQYPEVRTIHYITLSLSFSFWGWAMGRDLFTDTHIKHSDP